ncbi:hypothetical protein [Endozoicomonas sp. GU-1]|uniref:hypothetical protein n=1 Tax=Endozoicomonas sp. GU-1 TaxID=3009078 RepID=UPI0022B5DA99|nr:hypothetical protein [Endozoicomonas sp. GU-1]WBA79590.1 hypothetical protein O2T12_14495 [Endozoicomonas sp. GU-1]
MSQISQIVDTGKYENQIIEIEKSLAEEYPVTTAAENKELKRILKPSTSLRTKLTKRKRELKAMVDDAFNPWVARIEAAEEPHKAKIKAFDAAAKVDEQKRVEEIQHRIECFKNIPLAMLNASSGELRACIDDLKADPVKGFVEFEVEALKARNDAVAHLEGIYELRIVQEKQTRQEPEEFAPFAEDESAPFAEDDIAPFVDDEPFSRNEEQLAADRQEAIRALMQYHSLGESAAHAIVQSIEAGHIPGVYTVFNYDGQS